MTASAIIIEPQNAAEENRNSANPLDEAKRVFQQWLYLPDTRVLDFTFGVYFANRLGGDPVWGGIIGPPGDAKTEILRSLTGSGIKVLSKLTPRTLISGLRKGPDCREEPSLLPKLDGKLLIIKDLTPMIDGPAEPRAEILGQLRDAYDGSSSAAFGTGEHKEFKARFGLLFACTPVIEKCWPVIAALGERFLYFRTPPGDDLSKVRMSLDNANRKDEMREELEAAVQAALALEVPTSIDCQPDVQEQITQLADFVAKARTPVKRNGYTGDLEYEPAPEVGTRLAGQLIQLARGIAVANEWETCDARVMPVILHVARSAIPSVRWAVLKVLVDAGAPMTTVDLGAAAGLPSGGVVRAAEDLCALRLLERDGGHGTAHSWALSALAHERLAASGLLPPRG